VGLNFVRLYPKDIEGCSAALGKMFSGDNVVRLGYWRLERRDNNRINLISDGKVNHGAQRVYLADRLGLSVMVVIIVVGDVVDVCLME